MAASIEGNAYELAPLLYPLDDDSTVEIMKLCEYFIDEFESMSSRVVDELKKVQTEVPLALFYFPHNWILKAFAKAGKTREREIILDMREAGRKVHKFKLTGDNYGDAAVINEELNTIRDCMLHCLWTLQEIFPEEAKEYEAKKDLPEPRYDTEESD